MKKWIKENFIYILVIFLFALWAKRTFDREIERAFDGVEEGL